MSHIHKSKQYRRVCNDTSRCLDGIFTIDNPEFEIHIPDIYPTELQFNKTNTSDKETSFLDLIVKVFGSYVHTCTIVYDKGKDFGCECHCWWTSESPRAHVAKFYGRLRLIRSVGRASKFSVF